MLINLKVENITVMNKNVNFTTNPRDAVRYLLKKHYNRSVKIGDIVIEKSNNKHNFDLFCITEISYNKYQEETNSMLVINYNKPDSKSYYKKLVYSEFKEKIRIEIKLDKKEKCQKTKIQKFKNFIFKLFI